MRLEEIVRGNWGQFLRKPPHGAQRARNAQLISRVNEALRAWPVRRTQSPAGFDRWWVPRDACTVTYVFLGSGVRLLREGFCRVSRASISDTDPGSRIS